jgi:hypothetical protein
MTDLDVVNRALVLMGVEQIGALTDNGKAARTMSALLPECKKVVLNEFPWSFAMRIEPLVATSGYVPPGYSMIFNYPAGALSIYRVYARDGYRGVAEFRVIDGKIAANIHAGTVEYTGYVDSVDVWPRQIAEALCTRLSSDGALTLTGDQRLASGLFEKYMSLAQHAAQTSVVEENIPPLRATDYIRVRGK